MNRTVPKRSFQRVPSRGALPRLLRPPVRWCRVSAARRSSGVVRRATWNHESPSSWSTGASPVVGRHAALAVTMIFWRCTWPSGSDECTELRVVVRCDCAEHSRSQSFAQTDAATLTRVRCHACAAGQAASTERRADELVTRPEQRGDHHPRARCRWRSRAGPIARSPALAVPVVGSGRGTISMWSMWNSVVVGLCGCSGC